MSAELALPKYNLNAEQEKNEIVRHYRALSRSLRPKLKKGDKELVRQAFEMAADAPKRVVPENFVLVSMLFIPVISCAISLFMDVFCVLFKDPLVA